MTVGIQQTPKNETVILHEKSTKTAYKPAIR